MGMDGPVMSGRVVVVTGASSGVGRATARAFADAGADLALVARGHDGLEFAALAYRGIPLQSAYCGAKHAVQGFSESVRCELLHQRSSVRITMVQLPALNTPHFDVALARLPREPQPVPPIYQPEIAAKAVVWASEHPRRELWVGGSTAATLIANSVVPGLLDRYLGRTGYSAQQSDEPIRPGRPSNLWDPVPGDRGAHGHFDARSHARSIQFWLTSHAALAAEMARSALERTKR